MDTLFDDRSAASSTMKYHPLADIFPLIEGEALDGLVADIKVNGLREPIVVLDDLILDGRNRYRACQAASVEPRFRTFEDSEGKPLSFVISANLKRRHLNESQRAMVAAKLANMPAHRPATGDGKSANLPTSQPEAAKMLNVSERSIRSATVVLDQAQPELVTAVEQGHLAVSVATGAAKLTADQQREIAERATAGDARAAAKVTKQAQRAALEKTLATKQIALPDQQFGVILADPEWKFETWSADGMQYAADNHYPTSTLDVIKARDVPKISAQDCVLFLWATVPMLPQALEVMGAWGFRYVSHVAWIKDRAGNGYWFRNKHELLLVGTRGKVPAPAMGMQWVSAIEAPVGEHSAKPEAFLEMIEEYYPTLPKIELNRRGKARDGWSAWGQEAEQ